MSIPLDRLYHYIESIAQEICESNVVIYRFYPHGSKKVEDLGYLRTQDWQEEAVIPHIYCNDQEPLNFNLYDCCYNADPPYTQSVKNHKIKVPNLNFRRGYFINIYDQCLLLHSEKRSEQLDRYRSAEFIPVYYWSHALIARDWFRYAKYIQQNKLINKTFLVYNRAWSGTREYRLGFADRLIRLGLENHTLMRISPVDSTLDKHYDLHQFKHPEWRPHNVIEKHFPLCAAESHYSADFDQGDYENTIIEIVLETLFDDLRLHLTEKTLRPIAMGQPFMLASTYGSLKYLREYGFKTFADCWDESYDMMSDSLERMNKIVEVMGNIVSMPPDKQSEMLVQAQAIADYNKQHFFSKEFQKIITNELVCNLTAGLKELEDQNTSRLYINWRKDLGQHSHFKKYFLGQAAHHPHPSSDMIPILAKARKYYLRTLSKD
jgi:hypothetical protein